MPLSKPPILLLSVEVYLIKKQNNGDIIRLRCCQKTIDKSKACLGLYHRNHEQSHIYIGRKYMRLLREVRSLADDVVTPRADSGNVVGVLQILSSRLQLHPISHHHGVGRADSLEPQVTLNESVTLPSVTIEQYPTQIANATQYEPCHFSC